VIVLASSDEVSAKAVTRREKRPFILTSEIQIVWPEGRRQFLRETASFHFPKRGE
jgi:hypothetical protein